jgi:Holliday junction resolvase
VAVTGETDEAEEEAERELADAIAETGFDMLRSVCFEN